MASSLGKSFICTFSSFFLIFQASIMMAQSSLVFHVGGSKGWILPLSNQTDAYNRWAIENRFHIGDSLYFRYRNDSLLVVDRESYHQCSTAVPLLAFTDGNTTVQFDRHGFFYFISGSPGHCEGGQRLIVRVMVHPAGVTAPVASPAQAPTEGPATTLQPGGGGDGSDPGTGTSKEKASAASMAQASFFVVLPVLGVLLFA